MADIDQLPDDERRIGRANVIADQCAKQALNLHARDSPRDLEELDALIAKARTVTHVVGSVPPCSPSLSSLPVP
eukprot:1449880-Pyramimonas_sp.AAC.1